MFSYSKTTLAFYDFWVLGISNRFIWKCPTSGLLALYNRRASSNHLDCGVGTGFYLDRCSLPANPRVVLVDLNPEPLRRTARRIRRYHPRTYLRSVLEPLAIEEERFDSIGLNYLLHCLPGDIRAKGVVFDHVAAYLNPGGTLFGSTLLHGGVERGAVAQRLMAFYNRRGIFCNAGDDLAGLRRELAARFQESHVQVAGCAALFWARG